MDLEILLSFDNITKNMSENEKSNLADTLGIDYEEYKVRIVGKEKEAEFITILKSLETLKHFEAYDESLSHITKEYTPDFKVVLKDGYEMYIEVKHTEKDKFEISKGNLEKRIAFAERNKIPLRFAISIKGIWGFFTSEDLKAKNGKLQTEDFLPKTSCSWLDRELATCSYMFPEDLKIKSVYSKNHSKAIGIEFPPHGHLVSYELYKGNKKIFRIKGKNSPYLTYTFYLEELQNRLSKNQKIEKNGEFTIITETTSSKLYIPEYKFLLAPITHMKKEIDGKEIYYNPKMAIQEKNFTFLSVQSLRVIMCDLVEKGLDIIVFRDDKGYPFEEYRKSFWTKK